MPGDLFDDLVERATAAAFEADPERRGWEAVRTAALLRKQGDHERVLQLLDDVTRHFEHQEVVRAAYACAVAIHCDLGNPEIGIVVGRPAWDARFDPALRKALARAYWERAQQTGTVEDRDEWTRFAEEFDRVQESV